MNSFKAPPAMRPDLTYEDWKKEIKIWRKFTDLDKKKQGGALFLSLDDEARKTVLAEVPDHLYDNDNIVDEIIESLDKLLLKDDSESAFQAFDNFIKFRRPQSMAIDKFLGEFNLRYTKIKGHKMELPDGVLAYAVLTCANLPEDQSQICRATCSELTYKLMRKQIEKVTLEPLIKPNTDTATTTKTTFYENEQDPYEYENIDDEFSYEYDENLDEEVDNSNDVKSTYFAPRPPRRSFTPQFSAQRHQTNRQNSPRKQNPLDEMGHPYTCRFCKSTYHMLRDCTHAPHHMKEKQPFRGGRGGYRGNSGGRGRGNYTYGNF